MLRGVAAVIAVYLVFLVPVGLFFALSGRDPHAPASVPFMVGSTVFGIAFAMAGGYVASRVQPRYGLVCAALIAGIIALGAAMSLFTSPAGSAIWSQVCGLLLLAPAALAGGYMGSRAALPSTRVTP